MLPFLSGLVLDGLIPVFTTLLKFLPQVVILLTIVSLFENGGFTLGFGCTTLAVASLDPRLPRRELQRNIRLFTFIPCSAKLPVLAFMCGTILGWTVFGVVFLYVLSLTLGLIFGGFAVLRAPRIKKFNLRELLSNILKNTLEFLKRISGGVLLAATVLYALQYFSLLTPLTQFLEPLFVPLGLGSAEIIACLLFGLVAKEMIIGAILTFGVANLGLTLASGVSLTLFALLYTPCIPALTAIRAKVGTRAALGAAAFNFAVAYVSSFVAFTLLSVIL